MSVSSSVFWLCLVAVSVDVLALELALAKTIKTAENPNRLAITDLNNDGKNEVIVSSQSDGTITVFKNIDSDQTIASFRFKVGANPTEIATVDMNNDGYLDMVVANHESASFRILLNDKTGNFAGSEALKYQVKTTPHIHTLGIGDFNQDGMNDVVIDSWASSEISIYYLNSKAGFAENPATLKVQAQPRTNLVVANLDDDALPDVVTPATRFGGVNIVFGKDIHSPLFTETAPSPFFVAAADANADGHQDIITVHRNGNYRVESNESVTLLLGNAKGQFRLAKGFPLAVKGAPSSVSVGDIDGDGIAEIVTANYRSNSVTIIYKRNQQGQYYIKDYPVGSQPESVVVADINNDKIAEVVVANRGSSDISVLQFKPSSGE